MSLPSSTLVADMCVQTPWALRRNRFYFSPTVPPGGITQVEACMNRLMAVYAPVFAPIMTTQVKILRFEGQWFGGGGSGFEGNSTVGAVSGTWAAVQPNSSTDLDDQLPDTLPDEASLIIQKRTGNRARSKNGRWFFCGLSEQMQNAGQIDAQQTGLAITIATLLSDDVTVSSGFSTVLHARHYDHKNSALLPITKCYAIRTLGTRRDRRGPLRLERI